MSQIIFKSKEHRDFFLEMMSKCKVNDCYHRAFFYVMGIAGETRANIREKPVRSCPLIAPWRLRKVLQKYFGFLELMK